MPHVLIVDDEPMICRVLERRMRTSGYSAESVSSGEAALTLAGSKRPDLVLLDVDLGGRMDGLETLGRLLHQSPGLPVVIITGNDSVDVAVSAFKLGAQDFVSKPFEDNKLTAAVSAILAPRDERPSTAMPVMVGDSPAFQEALNLALRFARPEINVLLEGETGTGKELFARAIHVSSKRKAGPFVPVDCSILSESLIESELFGHEKGSFTGAASTRIGHFERANGGTLFLDEVGNLPLPFQAKLLRVLQQRTIERVGGRETIQLDVRVVSATNVPLREAVARGTFRSDLYYRLGEVTICPPTLAARTGDVERLAKHFARRYATRFGLGERTVSAQTIELLSRYAWPGNVRELENVMKAAVVLAEDEVRPEHMPLHLRELAKATRPAVAPEPPAPPPPPSEPPPEKPQGEGEGKVKLHIELSADLDNVDLKALGAEAAERAEKALLTALVKRGGLNQGELARKLNVDPKTLRTKLRKYGLDAG